MESRQQLRLVVAAAGGRPGGLPAPPDSTSIKTYCSHPRATAPRSEIKERTKKQKADKAAQKAAAKAAGGKPARNLPKGAGKAGAKSTGR